jgi:hypothetical protein
VWRRCGRPLAPLRHELVEFGPILGDAQASEEIPKIVMVLLETPQRLGTIGVEGRVSGRRRGARSTPWLGALRIVAARTKHESTAKHVHSPCQASVMAGRSGPHVMNSRATRPIATGRAIGVLAAYPQQPPRRIIMKTHSASMSPPKIHDMSIDGYLLIHSVRREVAGESYSDYGAALAARAGEQHSGEFGLQDNSLR